MIHLLQIQQELQSIAPSLIGVNKNLYSAPDEYFNNLSSQLLLSINKVDKEKNNLSEETFTTPSLAYFDNLSEQIIQKIKLQETVVNTNELEETAPLLLSISKQNVYTLPNNYFETVTINKPPKKTATVIPFKKIISFASAAVITGFLCFTSIKIIGKNNIKKEYIAAKQTNIEKSITQITAEELQKGVNGADAFSNLIEETNYLIPQKIADVTETLDIVTDEELETYLKQNPIISETELN